MPSRGRLSKQVSRLESIFCGWIFFLWTMCEGSNRENLSSYLTLSMYHPFSDKSSSIWSWIEFNVRKKKKDDSLELVLKRTLRSECYLRNESIETRTKQKISLQTMYTILRRINRLVRLEKRSRERDRDRDRKDDGGENQLTKRKSERKRENKKKEKVARDASLSLRALQMFESNENFTSLFKLQR